MNAMKLPEQERWFSVSEFCAYYGTTASTARRWVKLGRVRAMRVPPGPRARIYILDPQWTLIDAPTSKDPAEWLCFLRQSEVACLLAITPRALRYQEASGTAHYRLVGHRKLYSLSEVRRLLASRELGRNPTNRREKRRGILRWAARQLGQK